MFGRFIVKHNKILTILCLCLTGFSLYLIPSLTINQNYADYLPFGDPDLEFYEEYSQVMGNEKNTLVLALPCDTDIFNYDFLNRIHALSESLDSLDFVIRTVDLTSLTEPINTPMGFRPYPLLHYKNPSLYLRDSTKIMSDERLVNRFISKDSKTLTILIEIAPDLDSHHSDNLLRRIDSLVNKHAFTQSHIAGRIIFPVAYNRLSNKELKKSLILSVGLIILVVSFLYRSFWITLISLALFSISAINMFGYMALIQRNINAMANLIPCIILIVCISDVIHIYSKYQQKLDVGLNLKTALATALNTVGISTFLTSFSTAIGFSTLTISPLTSLKNFGLDMAIGVLITYFSTIIILPFSLQTLKITKLTINPLLIRLWRWLLIRIYFVIRFKQSLLWFIMASVIILSFFGIKKINRNNFILDSMPTEHKIKKDLLFFEQNLAGVRTFEMAVIPNTDHRIHDLSILEEIELVHIYLNSLPTVNGIYSPVTLYKSINKAFFQGRPNFYVLPTTQGRLDYYQSTLEENLPKQLLSLIDSSGHIGKISGWMLDTGRLEIAKLNNEIDAWITNNTDTSMVTFRHTGSAILFDKLQSSAIKNMFVGLGIAIAVISLLVSIAFRNFKMVVVTLVANLLPITITAAMMPILGIGLRYSTSIIFTVGFVIAIDDTIHFMASYKLLKSSRLSNKNRVYKTLSSTGQAIFITSIILFFAFVLLITSEFKDSYSIGVLVSSMLVIALLVDIIFVPAMLLHWFKKDRIGSEVKL